MLLLVLSLVASACGTGTATPSPSLPGPGPSTSPRASASATVAGCVPECLPVGGTPERAVPAGLYTTDAFFAGALTITLDEGWTVEDTQNELIFLHKGAVDWLIFVWIDPYPVLNLQRVDGIARTPAALTGWLLTNPTLIATPQPDGTVGAGRLAAGIVDLSVSDRATLEVADCPDICTNFFGFENGPDAHGIARPAMARLYLAPVAYGGQSHLLTVSFEANDPTAFADELSHAQELIDTITMPVVAAP